VRGKQRFISQDSSSPWSRLTLSIRPVASFPSSRKLSECSPIRRTRARDIEHPRGWSDPADRSRWIVWRASFLSENGNATNGSPGKRNAANEILQSIPDEVGLSSRGRRNSSATALPLLSRLLRSTPGAILSSCLAIIARLPGTTLFAFELIESEGR